LLLHQRPECSGVGEASGSAAAQDEPDGPAQQMPAEAAVVRSRAEPNMTMSGEGVEAEP
jgi:hypothetical protein